MADIQSTFDAAYLAAQAPQVRALMALTDEAARETAAVQLAIQGFTIDTPIMVWGWDAYKVMLLREQFGYTWVPSALQAPVSIAPGVNDPAVVPYDPNNPPKGSIKVTTNPADLPPFDPPAPAPVVTPVTDPVGLQSIGNIYYDVPGNSFASGGTYTDSRGTFQKQVVATPFGSNVYWEKIG